MTEPCLDCELFTCETCDSYNATPEYGCCCGRILPDPDLHLDGEYFGADDDD